METVKIRYSFTNFNQRPANKKMKLDLNKTSFEDLGKLLETFLTKHYNRKISIKNIYYQKEEERISIQNWNFKLATVGNVVFFVKVTLGKKLGFGQFQSANLDFSIDGISPLISSPKNAFPKTPGPRLTNMIMSEVTSEPDSDIMTKGTKILNREIIRGFEEMPVDDTVEETLDDPEKPLEGREREIFKEIPEPEIKTKKSPIERFTLNNAQFCELMTVYWEEAREFSFKMVENKLNVEPDIVQCLKIEISQEEKLYLIDFFKSLVEKLTMSPKKISREIDSSFLYMKVKFF